jgi:signal transduction histidine kinase
MKHSTHLREGTSLRTKLVLSFLTVALSVIVLMIIAVAIAIQNYFYESQIKQLRAQTQASAQQIAQYYQANNNSWDSLWKFPPNLIVADTHGNIYASIFFAPDSVQYIQQALSQSLQGQEAEGTFSNANASGNTDQNNSFAGIYVSEPILVNNKVIGAVLTVQPNRYKGFSTFDFLTKVNQIILIAGLGIALLVVAFSLYLTRRLTRPLISLTRAAEEMKAGNYNQRVEEPGSLDELGRLALTFNSMADKIATDVHELREQEQLRRDLIANIAHDLVTPLTAIQGYSEAIADDVISTSQERHETAQLIGREVQRLRRLVSDMQNMTSLESGRVPLDLAPLNLHDLVTETLAVIAPECEQAEITLCNEIAATTPLALADSDRIAQVLLNLLDNARRHTSAGGRITLAARIDSPWLVTEINDTGVGIDPQDLPYIFERFYRVDRSRNAASGGSGLGLAIIKAIITAHGGTVWARSVPGEGTSIFFTLPLAEMEKSADSPLSQRKKLVSR